MCVRFCIVFAKHFYFRIYLVIIVMTKFMFCGRKMESGHLCPTTFTEVAHFGSRLVLDFILKPFLTDLSLNILYTKNKSKRWVRESIYWALSIDVEYDDKLYTRATYVKRKKQLFV